MLLKNKRLRIYASYTKLRAKLGFLNTVTFENELITENQVHSYANH